MAQLRHLEIGIDATVATTTVVAMWDLNEQVALFTIDIK